MIEIKVGDFVETDNVELNSGIGYVTNVEIGMDSICMVVDFNGRIIQYFSLLNEGFSYEMHRIKRIGAHDLVNKDKTKPLRNMDFIGYDNKLLDCPMNQRNVLEMWDKINEIIEYINKEK